MASGGVEDYEVIICGYPRGIVLDEDGIRIAQSVGIYKSLFQDVGSAMRMFRVTRGERGLLVKPFLQFDYRTIEGGTGHVGFMCHKQPVLESKLRDGMDSKYGEIRAGCTVTGISEDKEHVKVKYKDSETNINTVRVRFLVCADGKTGFVRKQYLESRGVLMEKSPKFPYEAVWVALNWRLTPPTPTSHPNFPLWKLGYSPEEVYELFFPKDFNFICDPKRPSVCGRYGREEDRLWRFEFVVQDREDGIKMDLDMGKWLVTDYEAGDFVFHDAYAIQASTKNYDPEDRIRLDMDIHFAYSKRPWNTRWTKDFEFDDRL